jgi:hypothetical protein
MSERASLGAGRVTVDPEWYERELKHQERRTQIARATAYCWGRQDQGMELDPRQVWDFAEAYADCNMAFQDRKRPDLPPFYRALELFLTQGSI